MLKRFLLIGLCFSGLVIRPHAAEIVFNRSDVSNYEQYVQQLHELLQSEYTPSHPIYLLKPEFPNHFLNVFRV